MKRLAVFIFAFTIIGAISVRAQDDGNRVQWTPYDFSIFLPDGWITSQTAEYMILSAPDDINAMDNGETPTGTIVMVEIVEAAFSPEDNYTLEVAAENLPTPSKPEEHQFGDLTLMAVEIPPVGDRQGIIVVVADTYCVTASGPADQWASQLPMIETMIASIQAEPAQRAPADRLTQTIQWYDVRLRVPDNFQIGTIGPVEHMLYLISFENRLYLSRTFQHKELAVTLRDFSAIRHLFTLESLILSNEMFGAFGAGSGVNFGEITMSEIGGFEAASADFEFSDGSPVGRIVALRSPDSLYLMVGVSERDQWEATERDLFEAILATLERGD